MNRLIRTTSPYLIQHARNPVDWYPWGEEALAKARTEDKPILLSIGYAACHWCHIMAHESFEDSEIAAIMNKHFVNIKVDREERPDLDGIYMQAVTAMTGSGGWPMTIFLTPDLKPFYAGTYFPPVARYNQPSFKDILTGIIRAWREGRDEIIRVGGQIAQRLQNNFLATGRSTGLTEKSLASAVNLLLESYDWEYGGWGTAPKFPQAMVVDFLINHAVTHLDKREEILKLVIHCLLAMSRGGIYDVIGGGFSRYSTDTFWRVPHFEKMLYDNALLARTYLHAWQITHEPILEHVVIETLDFVLHELTHSDGGFYSSIDADSEGEEGKFYLWIQGEIRDILGDDFALFEAAYGITARGNWKGKIILQRALDDASLFARFNKDTSAGSVQNFLAIEAILGRCHRKLMVARAIRVHPVTDGKVLTAWNGFMLAVFAEAGRALNGMKSRTTYRTAAIRNAGFLLSYLRPEGILHRSWRAGQVTKEVFLEDYAAFILGLLELYQTDFDQKWFFHAQALADEMIEKFNDPSGGFFDTPSDSENLLIRPKEIQDNSTPSGNALACEALLKLAAFTDKTHYRDLAEKSLGLVAESALRFPTAFARWLSDAELAQGTGKQIALLGNHDESFEAMLKIIRSNYHPDWVIAASIYPPQKHAPALLADRSLVNRKTTIYVCEGFVCRQPVTSPEKLSEHLCQLNEKSYFGGSN